MNNHKRTYGLVAALLALALGALVYSCGQQGASSGGYTITGKYAFRATGTSANSALPVTDIVAIAANNIKTAASIGTDGSFSLSLEKGWPYAIGFYNVDSTVAPHRITLLGYLRQDQVNWHSLPLMNPTGSSTDLGTVEINVASGEALPSIDLSSLISKMNMVDENTARLYGSLDGPMAVFTNIDVNGNGVFDFQENKSYMLQEFVKVHDTNTAEFERMLVDYLDYVPSPSNYEFSAGVLDGSVPAHGTVGTYYFPSAIGDPPMLSMTGEASFPSSGVWTVTVHTDAATPVVPPTGTYSIEVASRVLTFNNFAGCQLAAIGNHDGIVYPVFKIITSESTGLITGVDYYWNIYSGGASRRATSAELQTTIVDTAQNGAFVDPSPVVAFFPLMDTPVKFDRDGGHLDLSGFGLHYADANTLNCEFNLTSRVRCYVIFNKNATPK